MDLINTSMLSWKLDLSDYGFDKNGDIFKLTFEVKKSQILLGLYSSGFRGFTLFILYTEFSGGFAICDSNFDD